MYWSMEKTVNYKILYFSTGAVYGEPTEDTCIVSDSSYGYLDPTVVRNYYAESKRMGENVRASFFQYGVDAF